MAADNVQVLNAAIFSDERLQYHDTLNSRLASQGGILRGHLVNEQALRNALRHANTLGGRSLGHGSWHAAQHAAQHTAGSTSRNSTGNSADNAGRTRRRRLLFLNHLNLLRNGRRSAKLAIVEF